MLAACGRMTSWPNEPMNLTPWRSGEGEDPEQDFKTPKARP
jgi:hypothetical protein